MKYYLNILVIVAIMVIAGNVNAGLVVGVPSGGGGSDGSGGGQVAVNQNISQHLDFPGINFNISGTNSSDRLSVHSSGWLEQGINGNYYVYEDSNIGIHFYEDDPSRFSLHGYVSFRIVSEEDYFPTTDLEVRQNMGIHLVDEIDFYSYSRVENRKEWYWEETSPGEWEGYFEETDDIAFSWSAYMENANIDSLGFNINSWEQDWGGNQVFDVLGINFSMQGHLIPEPATLMILGLGGLMLRMKRRR